MHIDLSGRTVLVTGGARGIGAAISRRFAEAGARVLIHYGQGRERAEALAHELGGGAQALGADLSEPRNAGALWREAEALAGRVHALVCNAGVAIGSHPEGDEAQWLADWERTFAVNLTSAAALCRAALAHFRAHGDGRIVTISSRAAFRGDTPDYLAYAASKGGLVALTKSIARGYGRDGIKAFGVAPGFTRTEMAQDFIDQYGEDFATRDLSLPALTEPDDVAPTVVFLASGLADHATGTTVDINAGSFVR